MPILTLFRYLPRKVTDPVLAELGDRSNLSATDLSTAVETAAVQAAVLRADMREPPENIFGPFTASADRATATVHWANMDSGAMINVVHSGVLTVFPALL